jgi:vancomycin permeability regulator SanA
MPKNIKNYNFIFITVLLLLQLIFLYLVKYLNQDLPLSAFSIWKIGNILNLIIYIGIIIPLFLILKKEKVLLTKKTITLFLLISWLLLLLSFISTKVKIVSDGSYIFSQPLNKVITGLLFLTFLLSLFYFLTYLWSLLFNKQKPKVLRIVFLTVVMVFSLFIFVMIYIYNIGYTSGRWALKKNKENIGVVLGAAVWSGNVPSPTLSARVDKALDLLDHNFVGKIVLTGGNAPGELPESEVAYEYAKVKGVDTSSVIVENLTSSTTDQIRWIKNNLRTDNTSIDIILISDAYHLPRAIEISKFFNINVKVAESAHKLDFKDTFYNKIRESIALFNFWNFAL